MPVSKLMFAASMILAIAFVAFGTQALRRVDVIASAPQAYMNMSMESFSLSPTVPDTQAVWDAPIAVKSGAVGTIVATTGQYFSPFIYDVIPAASQLFAGQQVAVTGISNDGGWVLISIEGKPAWVPSVAIVF